MEQCRIVLVDTDDTRRGATKEAVLQVGHVVVGEASSESSYRQIMQAFVSEQVEVDFFLCDRNVVQQQLARRMWAVGARAVRFGQRESQFDGDILPDDRTIASVLAEIAEIDTLE